MLDLLSLETRARHGRAVSLRLTSDGEAATCREDGLSGLLESMAAKSVSEDRRKIWTARREATRFPTERRLGQCYKRRLEVIREESRWLTEGFARNQDLGFKAGTPG
ncbi:uncharacterized protein LOC143425721 [Xylocopa sonorina]|uniref:uncharacterized protein LOC143425721 n=1 Tax=Xylocopa sonorina TaxID=1818115 RepID=UPI00403B2FC2